MAKKNRDEKQITRRRFIHICVGLTTAVALPDTAMALKPDSKPYQWTGFAMGAETSISIYDKNAENLLSDIHQEIANLESIFSLYDNQSQLRILNDTKRFDNPSPYLVSLLKMGQDLNLKTANSFNMMVQPLWELYDSSLNTNNKPPSRTEIQKAKTLCNADNLVINGDKIELLNHAKITLNGIAQGYMSDVIADSLRQKGISSALVNIGEYHVIGTKPNNTPWTLATMSQQGLQKIQMNNYNAMATSSPSGTRWQDNIDYNHLFNSATGEPTNNRQSITVLAKNAMLADGLSTAIAVANKEQLWQIKKNYKDIQILSNPIA